MTFCLQSCQVTMFHPVTGRTREVSVVCGKFLVSWVGGTPSNSKSLDIIEWETSGNSRPTDQVSAADCGEFLICARYSSRNRTQASGQYGEPSCPWWVRKSTLQLCFGHHRHLLLLLRKMLRAVWLAPTEAGALFWLGGVGQPSSEWQRNQQAGLWKHLELCLK